MCKLGLLSCTDIFVLKYIGVSPNEDYLAEEPIFDISHTSFFFNHFSALASVSLPQSLSCHSLHRVAEQEPTNRMSPYNLAVIFAPCLFQGETKSRNPQDLIRELSKQTMSVLYCIYTIGYTAFLYEPCSPEGNSFQCHAV